MSDSQIENADTKRMVWENKKAFMQSRGRLIVMRECEWRALRNQIDIPETHMHNILERDTEYSLLEAIREGKVFGFLGEFYSDI